MADWLKSVSMKNLKERLGKLNSDADAYGDAAAPPPTLRARLEQERSRLREDAAMGGKSQAEALAPGESREDAQVQDRRVLIALLGWKLDVRFDAGKQPTTNPAKVDGYWFGVRRYWRFAREEGQADKIGWKLFFHRPCPHCKALIPTLELGDYSEIDDAAAKMMTGDEAWVGKSTQRLAAYLNDLEAGRPDPHCPRMCPGCRKLLKGGTL